MLAAVGLSLLMRAPGVEAIPDEASRAADAAGCGAIQSPEADPQGGHLSPGQTFSYPREPATSGPHDPSPLPSQPPVYTQPVLETKAVHNLEHAYVVMYYRADETDPLEKQVVRALASLANGEAKVLLAPDPSLPSGTALALAAWNKLWECPASVTPEQARTIASGFIKAYRGSANAPEPSAP